MMNSIEAMVYCLGFVDQTPEDGEFLSQRVYDCNGDPHWFAFSAPDKSKVRLCSESPTPFASSLLPYRFSREKID
jgi:hypothetical protein